MHGSVVRQAMFNVTTITVTLIFLLDNITVQGMGESQVEACCLAEVDMSPSQ